MKDRPSFKIQIFTQFYQINMYDCRKYELFIVENVNFFIYIWKCFVYFNLGLYYYVFESSSTK